MLNDTGINVRVHLQRPADQPEMRREHLSQYQMPEVMEQTSQVGEAKQRSLPSRHHARENARRLSLPDGLLPVIHITVRMILRVLQGTPQRQAHGQVHHKIKTQYPGHRIVDGTHLPCSGVER